MSIGVARPEVLEPPTDRGYHGASADKIESYSGKAVTVRTTRQLSITLPNDMADALRERVQSGEYASESEVIREGLRALWARDQAVERWLHGEVAEAYDALVADPSHGRDSGEVRARIAAKWNAAL